MHYPPFFDHIPSITLHDPLTALLGINTDGKVSFSYLDCVKLAGHSCPTTAGIFLMLKVGLGELYPDTLPCRGDIRVAFRQDAREGTTGVMAAVASQITGASDERGFKGLGGSHARTDRLFFNEAIPMLLRLSRLDTGSYVDIGYDPSGIAEDPLLPPLKSRVMGAMATEDEIREFGRLWQKRVEKILESKTVVIVRKGA